MKGIRAFLFSSRYPLWLLGALAAWFGVWAIRLAEMLRKEGETRAG